MRQAEVGAARTMIERVHERFGLWPERLAADTAYGSAEMLDWLVHEQGIEPHIPVFDKSTRTDGTFSRSDFAYRPRGRRLHCPDGKLAQHAAAAVQDATQRCAGGRHYRYRASKHDCVPAR